MHDQTTSEADERYAARVAAEKRIDRADVNVHDLPPIFHYWSHRYLRPLVEGCGFTSPHDFFRRHLTEAAERAGTVLPEFLSIGAGNCETEIGVAVLLRDAGLRDFTLECLDLNRTVLDRGAEAAKAAGVAEYLRFTQADVNTWQPAHRYHAVMANHSLDRVVNLEALFDAVRGALHPRGAFVVSGIIGRNGHMRWPEALDEVQRFWAETPPEYRYNHTLKRYEEQYENWDCSAEGLEGIRAQDIVPLLLERFAFALFLGFCNVITIFTDRAFGYNFDPKREWDRAFIDRVQAFDEQAIRAGALTPCQMFAVLTTFEPDERVYARGVPPEWAVHPSLR